MPIQVEDLTTLDPTLVAQADAELTTLLQEYNPDIELRAGVFHDQLLHLKGILDAATQTNINRVRQSNSLQVVTEDPTLADTEIVDALLSNYNIVRNPGTQATGSVTIVISQLLATVIPAGSVYTINGLEFAPIETFAGRTSPSSVLTPNDILIIQTGPSEYAFSVPMTALVIGAASNVLRASQATPDTEPAMFVKAFAKSDFTGGTDADTNEQLISRLASGMAIEAWANRPSIEGLLRKQETFANIKNLSIVGFGDAEMLRDQHSIWPGSLGGRTDIYLRSQELYEHQVLVKTATLVAKVGPLGTWQVGIGLDDAPGFYLVDRVLLPSVDQSGAGFAVTSDVRSLDLISPTLPPPDLVDLTEGVYSRYQAAVVQFDDTVTDATALPLLSTQDYNLVMRVMPLVGEAQDFLNERTQRPPAGDALVKAPVPCFTVVSFTVNYDASTATPSTTAIQNAVASAVNNMGFTGTMASSLISQTLHDLLTNLVSVTSISMSGTIRRPDATNVAVGPSSQQLLVPSDPANLVTGRTVAFFLRPNDVTATLNAVDVPDV